MFYIKKYYYLYILSIFLFLLLNIFLKMLATYFLNLNMYLVSLSQYFFISFKFIFVILVHVNLYFSNFNSWNIFLFLFYVSLYFFNFDSSKHDLCRLYIKIRILHELNEKKIQTKKKFTRIKLTITTNKNLLTQMHQKHILIHFLLLYKQTDFIHKSILALLIF